MATRALISFGNSSDLSESIAATYHHWDGYPEGLGAALFDLLHNEILGSPAETVIKLICEEPVGWSNIVGVDWSLAPAWDKSSAPQSYTKRGETHDYPISVNDDMGQEWLYHIDLANHTLHIFKYRYGTMLVPAKYLHRAAVDWQKHEPDWEVVGKYYASF